MLYEKNKEKELSLDLFKNPTSEYRGAPFWAWNTKLDIQEAKWQIGVFEKMGFGGFHMHPRVGLGTEYLGNEYMACIKACVEEAKSKNMLAYLYDEDKWPSGFAGGFVTKEKKYRMRYLRFTFKKSKKLPILDDDGRLLDGELLLAKYKIFFLGDEVLYYKRVKDGEMAFGPTYYAYLSIDKPEDWYNDQTYVDTMNKEAMDRFAEITYGSYQKAIGEEFGKVVPSIFTDEPQYHRNDKVAIGFLQRFAKRPWTDDFDVTFTRKYGYSILDKLPEVIYDCVGKKYPATRLHYYNHLSDRFMEAFALNLGKKCGELGIPLTGHLMEEPSLYSQTASVGDAMRHYKGFGYPGIDMLCGHFEYTTALQCRSMVKQYGKEAMLSELYGVARWNTEFCRYKTEGDWQAALGVTIRVPHLSLMSMRGEAKRDYPPSFNYQTPWFEKYGFVENHFARVNTALTRGKPLTDIAVIHPIESYWLMNGTEFRTSGKRYKYDKMFKGLTGDLLLNGFDFDFISEAVLPEICPEASYPLKVGNMSYKVVIVPSCITLRATTLERLVAFINGGGKVIIAGDAPTMTDGIPSVAVRELVSKATRIPYIMDKLFAELEPYRSVAVTAGGKISPKYIYQLRKDGDYSWLFIAHPELNRQDALMLHEIDYSREDTLVKVKGDWRVTEWDTFDGCVRAVKCEVREGFTYIPAVFYDCTSKLFRLQKEPVQGFEYREEKAQTVIDSSAAISQKMAFTLSEPNVMLLDMPYYRIGDEAYSKRNYPFIEVDGKIRARLHLRARRRAVQPWYLATDGEKHSVTLKYIITSEIEVNGSFLALEDTQNTKIVLNGEIVGNKSDGYYIDKCIGKVKLPRLKAGDNTLEVTIPVGNISGVEAMYLLGDFGVKVMGEWSKIVAMPKTLVFGDIGKQGLPFYGGKLTYHTEIQSETAGMMEISAPAYRAALLTVSNGEESKDIVFAPFKAELKKTIGTQKLDITAYISRRNALGTVHTNLPDFRMEDPWSYHAPRILKTRNYKLVENGILASPTIKIFEK